MRKLLIGLSVAILTLTLAFAGGSVKAWSFTVESKAVCDETKGVWKIAWKVNNPENEELTVQQSNRAVVPVGTTVAANDFEKFQEELPGNTQGNVELELKVNWPSDQTLRDGSASVTLDGNCEAPTPPTPPSTPPPSQPASPPVLPPTSAPSK